MYIYIYIYTSIHLSIHMCIYIYIELEPLILQPDRELRKAKGYMDSGARGAKACRSLLQGSHRLSWIVSFIVVTIWSSRIIGVMFSYS